MKERTFSRDCDRGQTLQDFLVGITLFLFVTFAALAMFPNMITPAVSETMGEERATAERVSYQIVEQMATDGSTNHLSTADLYADVLSLDEPALRDRYKLIPSTNINITVSNLEGDRHVREPTGGDRMATSSTYHGGPVATSSRIVTLTETDDKRCEPACKLMVRVW